MGGQEYQGYFTAMKRHNSMKKSPEKRLCVEDLLEMRPVKGMGGGSWRLGTHGYR
jgi:hypothetical protein